MIRSFLCLGIIATFGILGQPGFAGSEGTYGGETGSGGRVPTFTLSQAILTAVQRNPTLLNAEQEIKRSKGVIIQVRAQALPQINANANFQWIDPNLTGARVFGNNSNTTGVTPSAGAASLMEGLPSQVGDVRTPLAAATPAPIQNVEQSDISYAISVTGTQLIFNGTTFNQIRGTFFQRDSAYFSFRNILDQLISTVKTQFYQIIVNRDLVKVNENSSTVQRAASRRAAAQSNSATHYCREQLADIEVAAGQDARPRLPATIWCRPAAGRNW
jgi:outer membrane protein TolC